MLRGQFFDFFDVLKVKKYQNFDCLFVRGHNFGFQGF